VLPFNILEIMRKIFFWSLYSCFRLKSYRYSIYCT